MSTLTERPVSRRGTLLRDVPTAAAAFLVAGVVGGLVWKLVTPLPSYPVDKQGVLLDPVEVVHQADADATYTLIALVLGVALGGALLWWRDRHPLAMLATVVAGSVGGALVMMAVGQLLSPDHLATILAHRQTGGRYHLPLRLHADPRRHVPAALLAMPAGTLFAATVVLLGRSRLERDQRRREPDPARSAVPATPAAGDQ